MQSTTFSKAIPRGMLALAIMLIGPCTRGANPSPPATFSNAVSIKTFGAQANGADATAAIQAAIQAAETTSHLVYVPTGHYLCGSIELKGVCLVGDGPGSILTALDPADATVVLSGKGPGVLNLKLSTQGTKRTAGKDRIEVGPTAEAFRIDHVIIDGSNATGIIVYGSRGRITQNAVMNTKADAIHMTGDAHDLYVAGNWVRNPGDDCIAVVTYDVRNSHPDNCHNILIENNDVGDQVEGRGIAVVGGDHVTIRSNKIANTSGAGIYLASEPGYHTRGVTNVIVEKNQIDSTCRSFPKLRHPSIFLYSGTTFAISDIKVISNRVTHSPCGPFRIGANTRDIYFTGNTYNDKNVQPREATGTGHDVTGAAVTSSLLNGRTAPLPLPAPRTATRPSGDPAQTD